MPEMIKVRAVPGRVFPRDGELAGYVGYREASADEEADHVIPCTLPPKTRGGPAVRADKRFKRIDAPVEVPNTVYYRRGIADLDIARDEGLPRVKNALVTAPVANDVHATDEHSEV